MHNPSEEVNPPSTKPQIALALAGGGPLGLMYEIGALHALEESLEGVDFSRLNTYVGVSAGAVLAACLANEISTSRLCRVFINCDDPEHTLDPAIFLQPATAEYRRRFFLLVRLIRQAFRRYLANPLDLNLRQVITSLSQAIPAGFFDNDTIYRELSQFLRKSGRSNDFRSLQHKLYIVAVELDTGDTVVFGAPDHDHISIARAVQASTALPGLYPPVEIEGNHYVDGALQRTLHASVALEQGMDLVFCLNPIVPFDANLAAGKNTSGLRKLVEGGLPVVLSQTFRAIIHSRLRVGLSKYAAAYSNADVVLFEPDPGDSKMFFVNIFSFENRWRVCEHAYQSTRRDLLARRSELEPIFARHGIRLRLSVLKDPSRRFNSTFESANNVKSTTPLTQRLQSTLDRLQTWVQTDH